MILIADSGSSKTDWRVIHRNGQISQFRGIGFNPYYLSVAEMTEQLKQEFLLNLGLLVRWLFLPWFFSLCIIGSESRLVLSYVLMEDCKGCCWIEIQF